MRVEPVDSVPPRNEYASLAPIIDTMDVGAHIRLVAIDANKVGRIKTWLYGKYPGKIATHWHKDEQALYLTRKEA